MYFFFQNVLYCGTISIKYVIEVCDCKRVFLKTKFVGVSFVVSVGKRGESNGNAVHDGFIRFECRKTP